MKLQGIKAEQARDSSGPQGPKRWVDHDAPLWFPHLTGSVMYSICIKHDRQI